MAEKKTYCIMTFISYNILIDEPDKGDYHFNPSLLPRVSSFKSVTTKSTTSDNTDEKEEKGVDKLLLLSTIYKEVCEK